MHINNAYQIIMGKLTLWLKELIRLLPNLAIATVVLVLGFFVAKWVKQFAKKLFMKFISHETVVNLFTSVVYVFFLGVVIFVTLSILKLDKAVTTILAGAGILGLAMAFAFQDIAANFISGIFLSFRRPLSKGDIVKLKDYMGRVEEINLRDTKIKTFQGQMVIIPNKDVFQNPIENFSLLGKRRVDINIGVSYGDNLEKVMELTLKTVADIPGLSKEDKPTMFYQEFGGSTIDFVLRLWVNTPEQLDYLQVRSETIMRLKKVYDENSIMLPFPTTTLDFGVKGGTPLNEMPVTVTGSKTEDKG